MLGQSMRCFKRGGKRGSLVGKILRDSWLPNKKHNATTHQKRNATQHRNNATTQRNNTTTQHHAQTTTQQRNNATRINSQQHNKRDKTTTQQHNNTTTCMHTLEPTHTRKRNTHAHAQNNKHITLTHKHSSTQICITLKPHNAHKQITQTHATNTTATPGTNDSYLRRGDRQCVFHLCQCVFDQNKHLRQSSRQTK